MKIKFHHLVFPTLLVVLLSINLLVAQPSGGPYGPIHQTYELPNVSGSIIYVSVDGSIKSNGESITNPTTIESAFQNANSGDAIILRGGTYRTGNLIFNQGITIQPYLDEKVIVKGTYVADKWENLGNGLWTTKWNYLFPEKPADWWRRNREGKKTPLHKFNNDMVFVDGKFLQSAGWEGEVDENSFYIDYESGTVYIGTDPSSKLIEITAFDAALIRTTKDVNGKKTDKKGPVIKGITFTHYAYRAIEIEGTEPEGISNEKDHGKAVIGTTFENCSITFCSRVAGYFRGDSLVIRHCRISDTSTEGIYVIASNDVLLEKNIFTRNNIENITGYYPAAVKIFNQSYRVTCRDNLVTELPNSNGIWYDVGNVDGVFVNNWIQDVGRNDYEIRTDQVWPSDNGFFFEISKGAVCAGNVFVNCDHGIMVLNASDVKVYNNTFYNSIVCFGRNERSAQGDHFGWHPATGPDVDERFGHEFVNNLMYCSENFNRPLMFVWQPVSLCSKLSKDQLAKFDYNEFVYNSDKKKSSMILWSPANNDKCQSAFNSIDELKNLYPGYLLKSSNVFDFQGTLFKSVELGNFQLSKNYKRINGSTLPDNIMKAVRLSGKVKPYIGAYQFDE
ncbi:MAG: right-handed parallel beta-helix repeat-containing protein [Ignavibacteriales bacterium]|nr:MAG: right-handed parallel beta-helix repeat-containing protein [Ignavibacteriales bacterium]